MKIEYVTEARFLTLKAKTFGDDFQHNGEWYRRGNYLPITETVTAIPIHAKGGAYVEGKADLHFKVEL